MNLTDQELISGIRAGDHKAFEELYRMYYVYLCLIAEHITGNSADAEEVVSDVFVRLWNNRDKTEIILSVKNYLIKAVRNTSLNYIEQNKLKRKFTDSLDSSDLMLPVWDRDYPLGQMYEKEVMDILEKGINELPDACREIFLLSRNNDLKYNEIADKLGLSVNTIKTQIKIALSRLRENLKDFIAIILLLILL